jgi:hypothetical protein
MKVSFWLIPAEPFRRDFSEWIARLGKKFDAPVFVPHVTVFSGEVEPSVSPSEIITTAAFGMDEIQLRATGVAFSAEFTKTLFITFAENGGLTRCSERIRARCLPSSYELHPHLSLLYASVDDDVKRALAEEICQPDPVWFDALQAVATGESNQRREDIEAWRVIAEARLSAARS